MMEEAFRLIDDPNGESTYLRLSTRKIAQVERDRRRLARGALSRRLLAARAGRRMPKRRSSPWARSCPKRSPRGRNCARTCPASACSRSPRPTCSIAAGRRRKPRAGRASTSRATSSNCCRTLGRNAGLVTIADAAPASLVLARRRARPARRAARRRPVRPDRQSRRPLCRLPARRRRDHRSRRGDFAPERMKGRRIGKALTGRLP